MCTLFPRPGERRKTAKTPAELAVDPVEKRYAFRLYPNRAQEIQIQKNFGCVRFIYNYFLARRIEKYEAGEGLYGLFETCADLPALKRTEGYEWLQEADSASLTYALCDLDNAYKAFFRNVKEGGAPGFPKFKRKKSSRRSYRCKNRAGRQPGHRQSIEVEPNRVKLPKLGWVEARVSRAVEGRILSATVLQNPSGKYFVSLYCTDYTPPEWPQTGRAAGLHLGAGEMVVASDGQTFANPRHLSRERRRLIRLQRRLARKTSGSRNREKARRKLAVAFERVRNRKKDALHKLTTRLTREYDTICLRAEPVARRRRRRPFGKYLAEANLGELTRCLTYKCAWYGKTLVKVDEFFPAAQICAVCGHKSPEGRKHRLEWTCPHCGARRNRAENAALNILNEGLRQQECTPVRSGRPESKPAEDA
jgi:putative transposase